MNRIVTLNHELVDLAGRARKHLLSEPLAGVAPVQISAASVEFADAYFYGLNVVPITGAAPTANTGSVFVGEKDANGIFCVDEIAPGAVVRVSAAMGTKLNLRDFWFSGGNAGDRVLIKYQ